MEKIKCKECGRDFKKIEVSKLICKSKHLRLFYNMGRSVPHYELRDDKNFRILMMRNYLIEMRTLLNKVK